MVVCLSESDYYLCLVSIHKLYVMMVPIDQYHENIPIVKLVVHTVPTMVQVQ